MFSQKFWQTFQFIFPSFFLILDKPVETLPLQHLSTLEFINASKK